MLAAVATSLRRADVEQVLLLVTSAFLIVPLQHTGDNQPIQFGSI
jgi:hypothetical protein